MRKFEPSESLNIHQRVLGIMSDLDYIQKGPKTVNGQYRFTSHDQVTEAVHPLLVKWGVLIIPTTKAIRQEGNRTEALVSIAYINVDKPTDMYTVDFPGYGVDSGDKGPGKAISYACKYGILKPLNLATGEDPDKDAKAAYEPVKCVEFDLQLPADITEKERNKLQKFLEFSAEKMEKHVEEVKREALTRMDNFIAAFRRWTPEKDKK